MGAVNAKVDEKRAQAAEIDRRIAEKMAELDRLNGEIGEKIELRNEVGDDLQRESARLESLRQGTRAAGAMKELEKFHRLQVRGFTETFEHRLLREVLDAQERRERLERQLRSLETASGR